jgi:hypothetical protein
MFIDVARRDFQIAGYKIAVHAVCLRCVHVEGPIALISKSTTPEKRS